MDARQADRLIEKRRKFISDPYQTPAPDPDKNYRGYKGLGVDPDKDEDEEPDIELSFEPGFDS